MPQQLGKTSAASGAKCTNGVRASLNEYSPHQRLLRLWPRLPSSFFPTRHIRIAVVSQVAVHQGPGKRGMPHAAYLVFQRGQHPTGVDANDVLKAVLALVAFLGDQPVGQQPLVRAGEIGDADLQMVAVISGQGPTTRPIVTGRIIRPGSINSVRRQANDTEPRRYQQRCISHVHDGAARCATGENMGRGAGRPG